jgi:hypothetical protein
MAWYFAFFEGGQGIASIEDFFDQARAWAVHDGDIAGVTAPVPEPSTLLLFGSGLAGLGMLRRRIRRKRS